MPRPARGLWRPSLVARGVGNRRRSRWAGRLFDGWLPYPPNAAELGAQRRVVVHAAAAGRSAHVDCAVYATVAVDAGCSSVSHRLESFSQSYYGFSAETLRLVQAVTVGAPERCASFPRRLRRGRCGPSGPPRPARTPLPLPARRPGPRQGSRSISLPNRQGDRMTEPTDLACSSMPLVRHARRRHLAGGPGLVEIEPVGKNPRLCTAEGLLHGGAIMSLADSAGGLCAVPQPARRSGRHVHDRIEDQLLRGQSGTAASRRPHAHCTLDERRSSSRPSCAVDSGSSPRPPKPRRCSRGDRYRSDPPTEERHRRGVWPRRWMRALRPWPTSERARCGRCPRGAAAGRFATSTPTCSANWKTRSPAPWGTDSRRAGVRDPGGRLRRVQSSVRGSHPGRTRSAREPDR